MFICSLNIYFFWKRNVFLLYEKHFKFDNVHTSSVFTLDQLLERQCLAVYYGPVFVPVFSSLFIQSSPLWSPLLSSNVLSFYIFAIHLRKSTCNVRLYKTANGLAKDRMVLVKH